MFVRSRGAWFGFAEKMFTFQTFCSAKSRKHVFSKDDCHPSLNSYSFTNISWSLRLLEKTWQQLFLWVINLSSRVICVVIAREIFLLKSDCPEITKCITNLKTTIKTEILPLNVGWPVGVCSVPSECLSAKICSSWSSTNLQNAQLAIFF